MERLLIERRSLLLAAGAMVAAIRIGAASDKSPLPLWPRRPPGGGGPLGPEKASEKGAVRNIAVPSLEAFLPTRPNGCAMLVAAGGGYKRIEMESEARPAARWLAKQGITAFALSYRLPGEGWAEGPLAPLQDAQRALRLIRAKANLYNIDPARVGVLGFSAGGHLMGLAATRSAFASYQPIDIVDEFDPRPAAAALIYPIITLEPPYDHSSTRRVLIGSHASRAASTDWSVQTHVRSDCPPVFLVQAKDDPVSDPANTEIMAEACKRAGVPVELCQLKAGGHGFGMGHPGTPTEAWPMEFANWLRGRGFVA
jgi:acetyl esterase/lipase